jgi:hypothetical protein
MEIIYNEEPVTVAANSGVHAPLDKRDKPPCSVLHGCRGMVPNRPQGEAVRRDARWFVTVRLTHGYRRDVVTRGSTIGSQHFPCAVGRASGSDGERRSPRLIIASPRATPRDVRRGVSRHPAQTGPGRQVAGRVVHTLRNIASSGERGASLLRSPACALPGTID